MKIDFAEGDFDNESIRDFDSGPGETRWQRRDPYWYRREEDVDADIGAG